jgi:hypothetical protein
MTKELRLEIEPPAKGSATVRLTAPGAVLGLVAGVPDQVVAWNTEPAEYEFRFATAAGRTRLEIRQFPNARRQSGLSSDPVAVVEGNAVDIARALWGGLRRLQAAVPPEEFAAAWRHPFPAATVRRLSEHLRE